MKIAISGASGFVGQHLCHYLSRQGHEIIALTRTPACPPFCQDFIIWDFQHPTIDSLKLKGCEAIIHLAAQTHGVHQGQYQSIAYETFYQSNVAATQGLVKSAIQHHIKHFVFLSSIKAMGEENEGKNFTEEMPCAPKDAYGQTKWHAEEEVKRLCASSQLTYTILRPPLIFGPQVKGNFLSLLQLCARGWPLPFKSFSHPRSLVSVFNLVRILELCLKTEGAKNQTFLVADCALSLSQVIEHIRREMDLPPRLFHLPHPFLKVIFSLLNRREAFKKLYLPLAINPEKILRLMREHSFLSWEESLKITAVWYRQHFLKKEIARG